MTSHRDGGRQAGRAAHARLILRAAIAAADPAPHVRRAIRASQELREARRVHLIAIGKAAATMAYAALDALPRPADSALVIVPHGTDTAMLSDDTRTRVLRASHPLPDASSADAAAAVEHHTGGVHAGDIVFVLLSGGASSLCTAPAGSISIAEYALVVSALMHAGADIRELNAVRAHIDRLKGGGMADIIAPAHAIGLVVSDVTGNPLDVIASGPLTRPTATPADALRVLDRYMPVNDVPASVRSVLQQAAARTPPARSFGHVGVDVLLDNRTAVDGAAEEARRLGYEVRITDEPVTGHARDAGR
ncbi:MAG: glycerate-2-kinase family protein, partial [Gemmatimonadetes bacterium]|nr:glycerate-2-kinase family protein [Gemmatimonadota bacterium]